MHNLMEHIRGDISRSIEQAIQTLATAGELPRDVADVLSGAEVPLEVPKDPRHGEFASPIALAIAKRAGKPPREVASLIVRELMASGERRYVEAAEIAGPGFINFRLSKQWVADSVALIRSRASEYGRCDFGRGERVMVEFVSANPVGPLNVVNARAAAVGDTLVRMFKAAGYDAASEFYVNDAGRQVEVLAESVYARYMELKGEDYAFPEDGYRGEYVRDIAAGAMEDPGIADRLPAMDADEARSFFRETRSAH